MEIDDLREQLLERDVEIAMMWRYKKAIEDIDEYNKKTMSSGKFHEYASHVIRNLKDGKEWKKKWKLF